MTSALPEDIAGQVAALLANERKPSPELAQEVRRLILRVRPQLDKSTLLQLLQLLARIHYHLFDYQQALKSLGDAVRHAGKEGMSTEVPALLLFEGQIHYSAGAYFRALEVWLKVLEEASELADYERCAQAYVGIGKVYFVFDDFHNARKFHLLALELAQSLGNYPLLCEIEINLSADYYRLHEGEAAHEAIASAINLMARHRIVNPVWEGEIAAYQGLLLFEAGELDRAEAFLLRAFEIHHRHDSHWGQVNDLLALGRLYLARGENGKASASLKQAAQLQEAGNLASLQIQIEELLAGLLVEEGDYAGALARYKKLQALQAEQFARDGTSFRISKRNQQRIKQLEYQLQLSKIRLQSPPAAWRDATEV